jgi:hypothetical protein
VTGKRVGLGTGLKIPSQEFRVVRKPINGCDHFPEETKNKPHTPKVMRAEVGKKIKNKIVKK